MVKQMLFNLKVQRKRKCFNWRSKKRYFKGRTLDNLEVRKALGEVAGYLEKDWKDSLANTQLQAFQTVKKQANLVGKVKLFDDLNKLNKDAELQHQTFYL